ncbi:Janus kinase and microtubule-interacting protein 1 [Aphelenchoides fujianensis]|nr:Janus kinase and microtubule-interacting protein 1 [Aphelenchoides fujianensis]
MNGGAQSPFHGSNASFNTLPRSSTSSSIAASINAQGGTPTSANGSRALPPRGFGTANYVLKDDYERERVRWQQKLEEAEEKLSQFSVVNTDLAQTKAQLNKKIIDIEKNQKPVIESNRRLVDRNRALLDSVKNLEESLSFVRDEKLTLKDQYDRLVKENASLKEQRAFPEKLEELERYRGQVLEYSKCITALRQSLVDKDRRHDLLVQKLRKIKKALLLRRGDDDDRQSCIGSEGSTDLDTIADLEEDPTLMMNGELQPTISEQLEAANATISELRAILGGTEDLDKPPSLISRVSRLQEEHKAMEERSDRLALELANARDTNDLLEFQLAEFQLADLKLESSFASQSCETDEFLDDPSAVDLEVEPRLNFDEEFVKETKSSLRRLYHLFALSQPQRDQVRNGVVCITSLEHRLTFAQNQLNMAECERVRLNKLADENAAELSAKLAAATETSSQRKKELKATIEKMKTERSSLEKEMNVLRKTNDANARTLEHVEEQLRHESTEKENFKSALDEITKQMSEVVQSLDNSNRLVDEYKRRHQSSQDELQQLEAKFREMSDERDRLGVDSREREEATARLNDEKAKLEAQIEELRTEVQKLREQIRPIGSELERRFEEERYRLAEAKRRMHKMEVELADANEQKEKLRSNGERDQREILQLRKFNTQLEAQFNSQMDIITELKKRYLDLSGKAKVKSESTESIGWTSKGSSLDDENYHSEEAHSEENYDTAIPVVK